MSHPKKVTIARALGVTPAAFSKYVRRGCPVYSVEAALAWQRQNVGPAQRLAQQRREAVRNSQQAGRYTLDQIIAMCLQAGEAAGMRAAFDWIHRTPQAVAAVLIRHDGVEPAEACRLATLAGIGLHVIGLKFHRIEDEDLAETFHGFWRGDVNRVRAELPDEAKLLKRATELAETLWPAA